MPRIVAAPEQSLGEPPLEKQYDKLLICQLVIDTHLWFKYNSFVDVAQRIALATLINSLRWRTFFAHIAHVHNLTSRTNRHQLA